MTVYLTYADYALTPIIISISHAQLDWFIVIQFITIIM